MQQPQQQFQLFHHLQHHQGRPPPHPIQQVQSDSQLEHRNSPDLEAERNRERPQNRSSMDFRNLCQRLDVDSLRAKLPSLPQIKLPKSLPKLRGRKIFRSSKSASTRATAGSTKDRAYQGPQNQNPNPQQHLQVAATSQQFINRTPQRISTISSLMYEGAGEPGEDLRRSESQPGTYRSAGSLDDDYYAPGSGRRASRPISPIKLPSSEEEAAASHPPTLTQRIQRGYKSLSELRLKHIFAKQTTVRRDKIEVDRYVEQYERELKSEKRARERRDREIAENYDIQIRTLAGTRQNTFEEDEVEREQFERNKIDKQDTDESGLEATPPLPARRKPGIAATRFAKVRKPPLEMEASSGQDMEEREVKTPSPKENPAPPPPRSSSYKQLLQKLPHLPSLPNLPQLSRGREERNKDPKASQDPKAIQDPGTKSVLRQNIKRIRKSIKRPAKIKPKAAASQDTDDGEESEDKRDPKESNKAPSSSTNLRARLGRFASTEQLQQRWRKSFKRTKEDASSKEDAPSALGGFLLGTQLEKTLGKLNEKMHQIKFFQRQGREAATKPPNPNTVGHEPVELDDDNELEATYHHSDSEDSGEDVSAEEAFGQMQEEDLRQKKEDSKEPKGDPISLPPTKTSHAARQMAKLAEIQAASKGVGATAWSSESLEEIADEDYPRVLIHQEHSDNFESTLIIAVATKSPGTGGGAAPRIDPKASPWLPNDQIIAGFKSEQSWPAPALYKPKSIDIFEASSGGSASAFADFDEALRNAPVLRISAGSVEEEGLPTRVTRIRVQSPQIGNSRESLMAQDEEEEDDLEEEQEEEDDLEEDEEDEEEEDVDLEMELPVDLEDSLSERPPSASPPPPPLPQRRPPPIPKATPIYDVVPPPLPVTKPPQNEAKPEAPAVPPTTRVPLPQRSASMSRPAKPLVKTSSLRLTYNEQVRPGDIGKVNKLISRFEGGRPRLAPRRMHSEEYERGSEEEEEPPKVLEEVVLVQEEVVLVQKIRVIDSVTPTNRNVVIPQITFNNNNEKDAEKDSEKNANMESISKERQDLSKKKKDPQDASLDRQNSNCSRSEYGSPLSFPSNRRSSTPTNNNPNPSINPSQNSSNPSHPSNPSNPIQIQHQRRSRRSMTRDDDNFYSFDSDEENSYYSISPSGSSRYVVEI